MQTCRPIAIRRTIAMPRCRPRLIEDVLTCLHKCQYTHAMANTRARNRTKPREERVSRTYRLRLSKLEAARRALGVATATEAIETALDLAVFRRELVDGTRA